MAIIATPVSCDSQTVKEPTTAKVFGCETRARRKAIAATLGQAFTVSWQLVDDAGRPVDLTSCFGDDEPYTGYTKLAFREASRMPDISLPADAIEGTVTDVENGQVEFAVPADSFVYAGVYLAEIAVFNDEDVMLFANQFYIVINRSVFNTTTPSGPPTIPEIRLHLRDADPADNPLLEDLQFDPAEIAAAIEYPILFWNESLPPIKQKYSTTSFPHRYHWLQAIISRLYGIAAHWYRRNRLAVQAQGGIAVDDLNKAQEYEEKSRALWEEYKEWVIMTKRSLNAAAAIRSS